MTSEEIQALLAERERLSVENAALRGQVAQLTGQLRKRAEPAQIERHVLERCPQRLRRAGPAVRQTPRSG